MKGPRVRMALRPLPLSIAGIALLFVVKLAGLLQGPGVGLLPSAQAAGHEAAKPPASENAAGDKAKPIEATPRVAAVAAAAPVEPGPSEAERALLQDLRSRRVALEARAAALEARDAVVVAAERRLSERVEQLAALQARLEALDQTRRERDEANWRSMVKTYETMRPRDAAAIFNDLNQPVLLQVLDRMKETKAAPVLAAMQPERARLATAELAKWRTRTTTAGVSP